jgi:DNA repair protein RadA/Sms
VARKERALFVCGECGHESFKWMGKCPVCGGWNTMAEVSNPAGAGSRTGVGRGAAGRRGDGHLGADPVPIPDVDEAGEQRVPTGIGEFDRVLGGGIVPGSVVLISGDPGIGKSTLLLQVSDRVARAGERVLYITGEESVRQIGLRARRLGIRTGSLLVMADTNIVAVDEQIRRIKPGLAVVDSVQTMADPELDSSPGSVAQVREVTGRLVRAAKEEGVPVFVVGHVTKSGAIAGPRVLEHMVDTVVYFEGETHHAHRLVRAVKNRFGSTDEVGIFQMRDGGLFEVENPSEVLLAERPGGEAGSAVVASVEGTRPLLVEVQALVARSSSGTPRRTTTGVDYNRAAIIVAVLDRRVGLSIGFYDIYVSVAGGVSLSEPAADLGIATAIASSFRGVPTRRATAVFGEIGLAGELRAVNRAELRIAEAARLGFTRCVIPSHNLRSLERDQRRELGIEVVGVGTLRRALEEAIREV